MFHIISFLAFLYIVWRFIYPLNWPAVYRIILGFLILVVSKYHLIQIWLFGTMFSPEMPRPAVILMSWLFGSFVFLFIFVVLYDLVNLVIKLIKRTPQNEKTFIRSRYILAVTALVISAIGVSQAIKVPSVKTVDLTLNDLPPSFEGYKVIQLTDLHISKLFPASWVEQVVQKTNTLNPDLILITGDLIDGTTKARRDDVAPLSQLRAKDGVIASMGNHEYYYDAPQWQKVFEQLGLNVMQNEHTMIVNDKASTLIIAAVTDPVATQFGFDGPDTAKALQGVSPDAPIILMSHRPINAIQNEKDGVDLELSGHTHGGMVWGVNLLIKYLNNGFVSGLYTVGKMKLYDSNGTALWNGFPIRLGVPSEITEFILHSPQH